MITLTYDRAVELLQEVVDEKGADYVYTTDPKTQAARIADGRPADGLQCYYEHVDKTPGCIIGHLIHKLNPELDLATVGLGSAIPALSSANIVCDDRTGYLALYAQRNQDKGATWGEALAGAIKETSNA